MAPRVPAGSRVYAVGDVHGRVDLLRELHQIIHEDAYEHQAPRNVVVYLGDYVDRGPHSREVIDLLLDEPLPSFESVHLAGNHEESFLRFLDDVEIGPRWMEYGGIQCLQSYGVRPPSPGGGASELLRAQEELRRRLPARHARFLHELRASHIEGDYFFVHAGVRPGVPLDEQQPADLLWIRDGFLRSDADHGRIVVHGHTIRERPEVKANRIGIDTGAYASGRLTALVLDADRFHFFQTSPTPQR